MDVLSLQGRISLDTSAYDSALTGAKGKAEGFGSTLKAILGAQVVQKGFQAVTGGFKSVVNAGMTFDSSMSQVAATMGLTMNSMQVDTLRKFAQEMGAKTAFSAVQCADALNYMALAGYDVETSQKMLPNVLNLAAAGNIDLARASDMVTDAQTALGLSVEETEVMVDQMAKTASTTNTSVEQLGDAFLTIGATARGVKGGTAELSGVLGVLADNGIKGSEGGTHLRNVILSLQNPTKKGTEALRQLGMSYDDMYDSAGELRSLPEIFQNMSGKMEGMTQQSKDAIVSGLFNRADLASVNALLGTTTERWDEVALAIDDAKGSAEAMAETQLDNLSGSVTLFKSALEGAQIAISDMVAPALKSFVDAATTQMQGLTTAIQEGGIAGALDFVGNKFDGLMVTANTVFPGVWKLWTTLKDIFGTVIDFIASKSGDFSTIFSSVKSVFSSFVTLVTTIWKTFGKDIMDYISAVWNFVKNIIQNALNIIQGIIKTITAIIKGDWKGAWEGIKQILKGVWDAILNIVKFAIDKVKVILSAAWTVIKNLASSAWNGIKDVISGVWDSIKTKVSSVWNAIKTTISNAINNVRTTISNGFSAARETISSTLSSIKTAISNVWDGIKTKISNVIIGIKSTISNGFNAAKSTVSSVFSSIKSLISDKMTAAKDTVSNVIDKIKSFFHFEWSLPKLKMPHLSISGSFNLIPPSVPHFSIEWYKKAYNHAYLFDKPTVGVGLGFGDGVGGEMVVGEGYLMNKISEAMNMKFGNFADNLNKVLEYIIEYFPQFASMQMVTDTGAMVGQLAPAMDRELGRMSARRERG